MAPAIQDLRDALMTIHGPGSSAILVSRQPPLWANRMCAEGQMPVHDPPRRQRPVASTTCFAFAPRHRVPTVEQLLRQRTASCPDAYTFRIYSDTGARLLCWIEREHS